VTISGGENGVKVLVVDNGEGMTSELRLKALRGGFTSKSSGTGLGLSICRHLLALNGAAMEIKSEVNIGTTIELVFPGVST
jgi:signal transduction histidine kinase